MESEFSIKKPSENYNKFYKKRDFARFNNSTLLLEDVKRIFILRLINGMKNLQTENDI